MFTRPARLVLNRLLGLCFIYLFIFLYLCVQADAGSKNLNALLFRAKKKCGGLWRTFLVINFQVDSFVCNHLLMKRLTAATHLYLRNLRPVGASCGWCCRLHFNNPGSNQQPTNNKKLNKTNKKTDVQYKRYSSQWIRHLLGKLICHATYCKTDPSLSESWYD